MIGYYTEKSWRLPKPICDVIGEHHNVTDYFNPRHQKDDERKTLLGILKLAEQICSNYRILGRQREDMEWNAIGREVLAYLEQLEFNYRESGVSIQNY